MTPDVPLSPDTRLQALAAMRCRPGAPRLAPDELAAHLAALPGWAWAEGRIEKAFAFAGFAEAIAFVNAVAWIAQRQDHHPDLGLGYGRCVVAWWTHDAGGVTLNDVICAARVECLAA